MEWPTTQLGYFQKPFPDDGKLHALRAVVGTWVLEADITGPVMPGKLKRKKARRTDRQMDQTDRWTRQTDGPDRQTDQTQTIQTDRPDRQTKQTDQTDRPDSGEV